MSIQDFFVSEGFSEGLNVSSTTRKFQTSVILKQDPTKSGILKFLVEYEESLPVSDKPKDRTQKPSRNQRYEE